MCRRVCLSVCLLSACVYVSVFFFFFFFLGVGGGLFCLFVFFVFVSDPLSWGFSNRGTVYVHHYAALRMRVIPIPCSREESWKGRRGGGGGVGVGGLRNVAPKDAGERCRG